MTFEQWERVKKLFDEALEHRPEDRAAFLEAACQGEPELRGDVEQLLAEDDITGGFLDQELLPVHAKPVSTGMRLGPYEILGPIGAGGMGEVYRARDTRLKRIVAVKVLPRHLWRNTRAHARFEREARAVAALSHPHICALYDIGRQEGIEYLVMEYLEGDTLADRLNSGPLLFEPFRRYAAEIASALKEAHDHGIIHRDLKPSNIMLTKSGAKLLDFGVAKRSGRARAVLASSTETLSVTSGPTGEGALVGTLAYMSPEQARGEELDGRTDLFSFGAVLYEMATGTRAFAGATPAVIIDALLNRVPISPRQINPSLPERVEKIITKALQKDRELRYQTAAALGDDLASVPKATGGRVVTECPYRGLRAFREEDAEFFAGREAFTDRLLNLVLNRKLVAVVGPSGSGKSSVVQAGLAPLLRQQRERPWGFISFTPGNLPFHRLAAAMIPLLEAEMSETDRLVETQKLANLLASGEVLLEQVMARVLEKSAKTKRLLIIADQFEELFTMTAEADREPFLARLLEALAGESFCLLLAMRADFYGHAIGLSRELSDQMEGSVINLGAMIRSESERALLQPASRVGLEFERGLVERILNDVSTEPGNLPLLEFALTELWGQREGALVSHRAYESIGAVAGAIAKRAEDEFVKLTSRQQTIVRRVFIRLVHAADSDEAGGDTRQRMDLDALDVESQKVVWILADARLLVTNRDESTGRQTAEVAHEALLRNWERLRNWVDENRGFLLWRQRLAVYLSAWTTSEKKDEWCLLRGALLTEARQWLRKEPDFLTEDEREFIEESTIAARKSSLVIHLSYGLAAAALVTAFAWYLYTRTDQYQVRNIIADAPYAQVINNPSFSAKDPRILPNYVGALAMAEKAEEAQRIALRITDSELQPQALASIPKALALLGKSAQAIQVALQYRNEKARSLALHFIVAVQLSNGQAQEALQVASKIPDAEARSVALLSVAQSLIKMHSINLAKNVARQIPFAVDRSLCLSRIGQSLFDAGRSDDALQILSEAQGIGQGIADAEIKCQALSLVAISLAKVGQKSRANAVLSEARRVREQIRTVSSRSRALQFIAQALIEMDQQDDARRLLEQGRRHEEDALFATALWLGKADNAAAARKFALKIEDPSMRIMALAMISDSLARRGKPDEGRQILLEAEKFLGELELESRPFALASIVNSISDIEFKRQNKPLLLEGVRIARQMSELSSRCLAMCYMAECLANGGDLADASDVLSDVQKEFRNIRSDEGRSQATGAVSAVLATLHRYRQARVLAETCTFSTDKLSAYAAILKAYAKDRSATLRRNLEFAQAEHMDFDF